MRKANTPALLRSTSFAGAEGLQSPLNDVLKSIQERISVLEQASGVVLLGPRRCVLPIDAAADPASVVEFQLPFAFTPEKVFLVAIEPADLASLALTIQPAGIAVEITGFTVRLIKVTSSITTGVPINITLGAIRG
jgi:hypothetical protein